MKNTLEFALRCNMEIIDEIDGFVKYRFDTRLIGGDYTIISVLKPFAAETVAREKLYAIIAEWD